MIKVYPAIIHKEDMKYWVEFPDLDGCFSDGNSLEEALQNAEEALGLYIASLQEEMSNIPEPSDITSAKVKKAQISENIVTSYIYSDPDKYHRKTRAVKKTLSIPEWLADAAETNHISLSKVLQEGLKAQLGF